MHATSLLYDGLPPEAFSDELLAPVVLGICCVTGETEDCLPRNALLGKSFTEQHLLRAPGSQEVGVRAFRVLQWRPERASSWLCTERGVELLDRQGVRARAIGGVTAARWAGYATTSYKKHGSLRTPVNSGARQVWLHEMRRADCSDRAMVADWWATMTAAQRDGIGRQSMEELSMPPAVMRAVGCARWEQFRAWAHDKHGSALYQFLCYLLPSREELAAEAARAPGVQLSLLEHA